MTAQFSIDDIEVLDKYRSAKGCYVFMPTLVGEGDTLGTVVFLHGYGALNPLNYGAWIRRIVDQGNVVIYPRYQRNLFRPGTRKFARNAAKGIRLGLNELIKSQLPVDTTRMVYIGHSYGGTLSAYMLAKEDSLVLPKGFGAVLSAPGTSRFSGSRLSSYEGIKEGTHLAIVTHEDDYVTKTEFAELLDATLSKKVNYLWLHQNAATVNLTAHHNESYALDMAFDSGLRNYTTKKALRVGTTDAIDQQLYWFLSDQLIESAKENSVPEFAKTDRNYLSTAEDAQVLAKAIEIRGSNVPPKEKTSTPTNTLQTISPAEVVVPSHQEKQ